MIRWLRRLVQFFRSLNRDLPDTEERRWLWIEYDRRRRHAHHD